MNDSFYFFMPPVIICQEVQFAASCYFCFTGNKPLEKQRIVVCYVAQWAHSRVGLGRFTVDDIVPTLCTHLIYAFAVLDVARNSIESMSPDYDLLYYNGTGWCLFSHIFIVF
jgi:hypothetical protein